MAIYTGYGNGLAFNVNARTIDQAVEKADSVFTAINVRPQSYTVFAKNSAGYNENAPKVSTTSIGHNRYKVNPNTNKKVLASLIAQSLDKV